MSVAQVLLALRAAGIHLAVDGPRLIVDAPTDAMTADLRQAIRQHRALLHAITQAATAYAPLPRALPALHGDDYFEAEALIKHALGCQQSARLDAALIAERGRRDAVGAWLALQEDGAGAADFPAPARQDGAA